MNRSQRRKLEKQGIKTEKEKVINIKTSDVQKIKEDAAHNAADTAFF